MRNNNGNRGDTKAQSRRWRARQGKESLLERAHKRESRDMRAWLQRCIRNRRSYDRKCGREFDLDLDYVMALYAKQNGYCAITGVAMAHGHHNLRAASIDRIDSAMGHVRGNVQLVCAWINLGKCQYSNTDVKDYVKEMRRNLLTKLVRSGKIIITREGV